MQAAVGGGDRMLGMQGDRRRDVDRLQARVRQQLVEVARAELEVVLGRELLGMLGRARPDGDGLELVEAGEDWQRHLGAVAAAEDGDLDRRRGHARRAGYAFRRRRRRPARSRARADRAPARLPATR